MAIKITIVEETAVGTSSIGVDVDSPVQTKVVVVDGLYVESSVRKFDDLSDTPALKIMDAFVASNAAGTDLEYVKPTLTQGQGVTISNPNIKDNPTVSARISDGLKFETNGDLSVDESVVRTSRKVVAGSGLSQDNPDLTTDITLSVEADRGLNVAADKVGISIAANSGLKVGATTEIDINGTAEETSPIGSDVFIMENSSGQKKRVTKDNLLAGLGKGAEIRGTVNPKSTDVQPINTLIVTGDPLNTNIMQGVTPNGAYPNGYLYVILLDVADKETGVTITMMGPTGSPISAVAHDQDQLQFVGDRFVHLETGNAVISVHGRKGVVTSENSDYTSSQIDVVPTGNLTSTNTQAALEEHQNDIDALDGNVADNTTLIQSLSETNSVGVWTSGVTTFNNSNDVAIFGGKVYAPKKTTTLPYTAQGTDPTVIPDNDFVVSLTNLATNNISEYVYKPNLLNNSGFEIAASGVVLDATPRDFAADEPLRDGWIAATACTGVTYINGEISLLTGSYYQDVPRTGTDLQYITNFTASIKSANGTPSTTGVSWSIVGDYFRITVSASSVFSVCFNEGNFAASHTAQSLPVTKTFDTLFTDATYTNTNVWGVRVGDSVVVEDYAPNNNSGILFFKVAESGTGTHDGGKYIDLPSLGIQLIQNMKLDVHATDYGVAGSGNELSNLQNAIDFVESLGGGRVILNKNVNIGGGFVNIKENVTLISYNTSEIVSEHNGLSHFNICFLKDGAKAINFRVRGSNKLKASDNVSYISYNKIGFSTQGAATGVGIRIQGIGFSQTTHSCCFVFNNHKNVRITECYTYGNMFARYSDINSVTGEVVDYNADYDPAKLANGTQVYNLLNFHNSGPGANDVCIFNNIGVDNITDSFCAPNDGAYDHHIFGNISSKTEDGYYGGYGLDFNASDSCTGTNNTFTGYRVGCHFYRGARQCLATSNTYHTPIGTLFESDGDSNISRNNVVMLGEYGEYGASCGVMVYESVRCRSADIITSDITATQQFTGSVNSFSSIDRLGIDLIKVGVTDTTNLRAAMLFELINCGTLSGLWSIREVLPDGVILTGSVFSVSHPSQPLGTWRSAKAGAAICRNMSTTKSLLFGTFEIEDVYVGLWVDDFTDSQIITDGFLLMNVPAPRRGIGALSRNSTEISGISAAGIRSKNFSGSLGVSSVGATSTVVQFIREEQDANYRILATGEGCSVNEITDKTTTSFRITHSSGAAGDRLNWMLFRA